MNPDRLRLASVPRLIQQLARFGEATRLREAENQPLPNHDLLPAIEGLHAAAAEACGEETAAHCGMLLQRAIEMDAQPGARSFLHVLQQFDAAMHAIEQQAALDPCGGAWWKLQKLHDVRRAAISFVGRAPDRAWNRSFRRMLCQFGPVHGCAQELAESVSCPFPARPIPWHGLAGVLKAAQRKLEPCSAARLCALLFGLRLCLDHRLSALWVATHQQPALSQTIVDAYAYAWNDLLECPRPVTPELCVAACEVAADLAGKASLDEVARFAGDPERLFTYALANLMPPAPGSGLLPSGEGFRRFVQGQLSRWYFRPFRHKLAPLDVIGAVLGIGRPLYYDRILAHALVQMTIFHNRAPERLLEIRLATRWCNVLERGYQLRRQSLEGLKQPEGWIRYLECLIDLHFGPARDAPEQQFQGRGHGTALSDLLLDFESGSAVN